ncbi:MAG: M48 family metalloprotease [Desulfobacteraceae bacterium]|nr:M48 family metalloprotease [Desulfobacteraceae bacterium]
MFTNFIYFLTALILYTTCYYPEGIYNVRDNAFIYALFAVMFFILICRISFKRLAKKDYNNSFNNKSQLDHKINSYIFRLSILALAVYCIDLYYFRLKLFFADYKIFHLFPTLHAIIFLLLFLIYLIIIWDSAWIVQKQFFPDSVKRKDFIISNISFSLPALIPWFLLSIVADIIQILPFKVLPAFLSTAIGEISYILIFMIAMAVFGPVLIQKIWRCKPLENGKVREQIVSLCTKTDFKYADILKWDLFGGSMITAGIMGLMGKFRYLLITPALISLLDDKEIDAVISHEIGHAKKKHLYFYVFIFAGYMSCIYFLFDPLMLLIFSSGLLYKSALFFNINHDSLISIVFSFVLVSVFLLYFRYVFGFFMRNFERQADTYVFSVMGDAFGLITTFYKIIKYSGQSPDQPNWHHFSITERIEFLRDCQADLSQIDKHNNKVLKMIVSFVIILSVVCITGYSINFGIGSKYLNKYIAQKVLKQEFRINQDNTRLYAMVGDYSYNHKEFRNAETAWQNALKVDHNNLHALNNLSWLYATCEDEKIRNKTKAYDYALRAIEISRAPYVLDTYAEACLFNNYCDKAVNASKEALKKSRTEKKEYYQNQYEKIKEKCKS